MHIPNDNGQYDIQHNGNGNGHNRYNSHFEWIDKMLIPSLVLALGRATRINYDYDFKLAEPAAKHAEYMMKIDKVCYTPREMMFGEAEIVGSTTVRGDDFDNAFLDLATRLKNDYTHGHNLLNFPVIGAGIALREKPPILVVYSVIRCAKKRVA